MATLASLWLLPLAGFVQALVLLVSILTTMASKMLRCVYDRTNEVHEDNFSGADVVFTNRLGDLNKADFFDIAVSTPSYNFYKLGMTVVPNWRPLRGFKHLAKVIIGVKFKDSKAVEEPNRDAA